MTFDYTSDFDNFSAFGKFVVDAEGGTMVVYDKERPWYLMFAVRVATLLSYQDGRLCVLPCYD